MYSHHRLFSLILCFSVLPLSGCFFSKIPAYEGVTYPATTQVKFTFQQAAIPANCKVFSHAIVSTPTNSSSLDIKKAITEDAKEKGANLVFLGLARTLAKGDWVDSFEFNGFGPTTPYPFGPQWHDWEYGFSLWQTGDEFTNFGYDKYKNADIIFEYSLMIKHALLRCQAE